LTDEEKKLRVRERDGDREGKLQAWDLTMELDSIIIELTV